MIRRAVSVRRKWKSRRLFSLITFPKLSVNWNKSILFNNANIPFSKNSFSKVFKNIPNFVIESEKEWNGNNPELALSTSWAFEEY